MGYENSWSYAKYLRGEDQSGVTLTDGPSSKVKECRCESHYLFCWGHEKQCDYYEDKK